jgi:hypothetical protein
MAAESSDIIRCWRQHLRWPPQVGRERTISMPLPAMH